jgi:dienelactone hydrolase
MKRRSMAAIPALALVPTQLRERADPLPAYESPGIVEGNLPVFYERLKARLDFPLAWGTAPIRDFAAWRRIAAAKVEELLWQPPDDTPFHPQVLDEQRTDGYTRKTVAFNLTRDSRVRAVVLTPDGKGPFPGVLLLHDHGAKFDIGKEKLVRPWYDELARHGYLVLAVDALGWGDRGPLTYEQQQALAGNMFNLGSSLSGLMAREDARAAEFLASMSEVDGRRVTALGFSMGAYRAWQTGALSPHVSAVVAACWMTTLKDMMVAGNNTLRGQSAFLMLHPGLYRFLDIPDVASIAAPKPALFFDGELDPLFTAEGVGSAYNRMRKVWTSQRAGDRLRTKVWPGLGHVFVKEMQDEAFAWLDHWMKR